MRVASKSWRSAWESEHDISIASFKSTLEQARFRLPKRPACKGQNGCSTKRLFRWLRSRYAPASAAFGGSTPSLLKSIGDRRPRYGVPQQRCHDDFVRSRQELTQAKHGLSGPGTRRSLRQRKQRFRQLSFPSAIEERLPPAGSIRQTICRRRGVIGFHRLLFDKPIVVPV